MGGAPAPVGSACVGRAKTDAAAAAAVTATPLLPAVLVCPFLAGSEHAAAQQWSLQTEAKLSLRKRHNDCNRASGTRRRRPNCLLELGVATSKLRMQSIYARRRSVARPR